MLKNSSTFGVPVIVFSETVTASIKPVGEEVSLPATTLKYVFASSATNSYVALVAPEISVHVVAVGSALLCHCMLELALTVKNSPCFCIPEMLRAVVFATTVSVASVAAPSTNARSFMPT